MLYWNVQSEFDGEATIEITYFTSGITWTADYVALADAAETQLGLEGFVRISNRSGEEYENAQVRLVVGTINLVEKIAQLAAREDASRPQGNAEHKHIPYVNRFNNALHGAIEEAESSDKEKKIINTINMGSAVYGSIVPANGKLFVMNRNQLFAIAAK